MSRNVNVNNKQTRQKFKNKIQTETEFRFDSVSFKVFTFNFLHLKSKDTLKKTNFQLNETEIPRLNSNAENISMSLLLLRAFKTHGNYLFIDFTYFIGTCNTGSQTHSRLLPQSTVPGRGPRLHGHCAALPESTRLTAVPRDALVRRAVS